MRDVDSRIKKVEGDIQEEYRRLQDLDGGNHALRVAEIEEKRNDVVDARAKLESHEQDLDALENDKHEADGCYKASQGSIVPKREEIQKSEERLRALMRDRGQQQGAYPASMSRLLSAIQQDTGFHNRPVGPYGHHIRLLKPKWSSILEKSFGAALNGFIVTNKPDQIRLSELMRRMQW